MRELILPNNPTLADYQKYVAAMVVERGFSDETIPELFMLLMEECGELAKAARKRQNIKVDPRSIEFDVGHEIADVFIYILCICDHFDVDLEEAFRLKEERNKSRSWS